MSIVPPKLNGQNEIIENDLQNCSQYCITMKPFLLMVIYLLGGADPNDSSLVGLVWSNDREKWVKCTKTTIEVAYDEKR